MLQLVTTPLILGSHSPRRKQLLAYLDIPFEVVVRPIDEETWDHQAESVAIALAEKKMDQFSDLTREKIVLTADTIVYLPQTNEILGKPRNATEAKAFLRKLSGNTHVVITGVCLQYQAKRVVAEERTFVAFSPLGEEEIDYYVTHYAPYDKAGGYGVQEWIGAIGVRQIRGDFYNIMGLPLHLVYSLLKRHFVKYSH